jgi:hypothetical protein
LPPSSDFDYELPDSPDFDPTPAPPGGGFGGTGGPANPPDPLEEPVSGFAIEGATGDGGTPQFGDTLSIPEICPGMKTEWYLFDPDTGEILTEITTDTDVLTVLPNYADLGIGGRGCCPDPGAPSGFAQCVDTDRTLPVIIPPGQYYNAREEGGTWQAFYVTNGSITNCGITEPPIADGENDVGIEIEPFGTGVRGYLLFGNNRACICPSVFDPPNDCNFVVGGGFVMYYRGTEPGAVFEPVDPDFIKT